MESLFKFELLALDTGDASPIQSEANLLHSLLGNATLWKRPTLAGDHATVTDDGLTVTAQLVVGDPDLKSLLNKAFLVRLSGRFSVVEPLRGNSGVGASFREADDHDGAAHGRCRGDGK